MAKLRRALRKPIVKQLSSLANHFGYEVKRKLPIFYLHQYASYEEYKEIQIRLNRANYERIRYCDTLWPVPRLPKWL